MKISRATISTQGWDEVTRGAYGRRAAFTMVELMVSMSVMTLLLLILVTVVSQTSATWQYTTGKVEQFRSARAGYEAMTRRVSQATLNTYWEYERDAQTGAPTKYVRQSELRFITGSSADLLRGARGTSASSDGTPSIPVGHGIFFNAPLGFVTDTAYSGMEKLINTWGYFVEFGSDQASIPPFLKTMNNAPPERFRSRLMELMQPSNELSIYKYTSGMSNGVANSILYSSAKPGTNGWTGREWFTDPIKQPEPTPVHMLAENVIALVILPRLSPQEDLTGAKLAPSYKYDSTEERVSVRTNPKNQLPPVVQVTLVALDERSADRLASGSTMPELGLDQLFQTKVDGSASEFDADLATLEETLGDQGLSYRVFTTNVSLRAARWSQD